MTGIYKITNVVNGKCYIGSAVDIDKRWNLHRTGLKANKHHSKKLQHAWNKYGESNFKFEVLLTCSKEELIVNEQRQMNWYKPEYNILKVAGSALGYRHTEEARLKMSKNTKGKPKSENHKQKISKCLTGNKINLGKHHTEETKNILRNANLGKVQTPEAKEKQIKAQLGKVSGMKGKVHTEETKAKISAKGKGRVMSEATKDRLRQKALLRTISPETRAKQAATMKGRKLSEEHKVILSKAQKKRWQTKLELL